MQHLRNAKPSIRLEIDPGIIFPEKLYEVAKDDYLIKWNRDGTSISIDESLFEERILTCYPGFVQISTFANLRRLFREYGFDWDANEERVFEFSHPNFLRSMPDILQSIQPRHRSSRFGRGRSGRGRSRIGVKLGPRKHRRNFGISTELPDSTSFRISQCEFNDDFNVMNHMTDSNAYDSDITSAFEPTSTTTTTMLSKTDVTDIIEAYRRNELLDAEEQVPDPVPEWLVYTPVPTISEENPQNQSFDPSLCTCCSHCKSRKSLPSVMSPDWSMHSDDNPQYYPPPMFTVYSPTHDGSGKGAPAEQDLGDITYL